jgi:hypothetical protein
MRVSLADTPAKGATSINPIFGEAKAEITSKEVRISLPPQSLSVFVMN